jgi:hypothetical protein
VVKLVDVTGNEMGVQMAVKTGGDGWIVTTPYLSKFKSAMNKTEMEPQFSRISTHTYNNVQDAVIQDQREMTTPAEARKSEESDDGENHTPAMDMQALAQLQHILNEASLHAGQDGDRQQAILMDGRHQAQQLIKVCLKDYSTGSEMPSEVTGYVATLGKIQGLIMQALAGLSEDSPHKMGFKNSQARQELTHSSPFRV